MATETGDEKAPTRRTQQHQPLKGREDVWKRIRKVRTAAVLNVFWDFVRKQLGIRVRQGDQTDLYKHLRKTNLEWERDRISAYIKYEVGILLRDVNLLRE